MLSPEVESLLRRILKYLNNQCDCHDAPSGCKAAILREEILEALDIDGEGD